MDLCQANLSKHDDIDFVLKFSEFMASQFIMACDITRSKLGKSLLINDCRDLDRFSCFLASSSSSSWWLEPKWGQSQNPKPRSLA